MTEKEEKLNQLKKTLDNKLKNIDPKNNVSIVDEKNSSNLQYSIPGSIMAFGSLDNKLISSFANNETICDCFISVYEQIFESFKVPIPRKFNFFTKSSNPDLINKKTAWFSYKYVDLFGTTAPANFNKIFLSMEYNKNIIFTQAFFKKLEEDYKKFLDAHSANTISLKKAYNYEDIKKVNVLKKPKDPKNSQNDFYYSFLNFLNKNENAIDKLRTVYTIEEYGGMFEFDRDDLPYGLDEEVNNISGLYEVKMDIVPSSLSAPEYFSFYIFAKKYIEKIRSNKNEVDSSITRASRQDRESYDEAKKKAEMLINSLSFSPPLSSSFHLFSFGLSLSTCAKTCDAPSISPFFTASEILIASSK
jgi:hypothetical protein